MTTVVITRPEIAIAKATEVYQKAGFEVFKAPCYAIKTNTAVLPQWLAAEAAVWIVLSVHALQHALKIAPQWRPLNKTRVIAVGPAVANAWQRQFEHPIEFHPLMNSEGVIELLQKYQAKSVKILTTAGGRNLIKTHCMEQQISYNQINTYHRIELTIDAAGLQQKILNASENKVILTATSSGILVHFMSQLPVELTTKVLNNPLVVGAQRIADLAKDLGFNNISVAANPSDEAMCEVVERMVSEETAAN
ncbi:uroporphyrinogen-III synthase [Marinicella litoralis]|uniref:Uroporphyrinogen-III synthase n=1 Tax=Marinicella litoralis TaxID=644220 RepID=A0A4V3DI29_9GAMM|nr:uroporphyrinogen-III synthase [Marinicella litoralis]TDR20541.1 uroporphyrinogen-III synthase [Marinicella litoralis]